MILICGVGGESLSALESGSEERHLRSDGDLADAPIDQLAVPQFGCSAQVDPAVAVEPGHGMVLARRGLAPTFVSPVSVVLARRSEQYIAALQRFAHVGSRTTKAVRPQLLEIPGTVNPPMAGEFVRTDPDDPGIASGVIVPNRLAPPSR